MKDLAFVMTTCAFFVVAALLASGCERLQGTRS